MVLGHDWGVESGAGSLNSLQPCAYDGASRIIESSSREGWRPGQEDGAAHGPSLDIHDATKPGVESRQRLASRQDGTWIWIM